MYDPSFLKEIEERSNERVSACYQCYRCTNGCPALEEMDIYPHRFMRYIILGDREKVINAKMPWACLQCYTCSVRCPNDIDVAHVINTVRKVAAAEGVGAHEDTWLFDTLFLDNVERHGRLNEMEVMVRYKLAKKNLFDMNDAGMGLRMFLKGRMGLKSHNIKDRAALKKMFEKLKG